MTSREEMLCGGIIHTASVAAAAAGGGMAQFAGSDNVVITPIQLAMTISLGSVFGIRLDECAASAALASTTGCMVGRTVSQFLVGWIPVAGNAINAATAGSVTEIIGWNLANSFAAQAA